MARSFLVATLAVGVTWAPLCAQQLTTADEKAVWALIESSGKTQPRVTDDIIFVSGAFPRPLIGRQEFSPSDTGMAHAQAEIEKRSGEVVTIQPQKVVVSKAGDMAYGFASFSMAFDRTDSTGQPEHVTFEGSQLTVWRKIGGEWRLAASFSRPNE